MNNHLKAILGATNTGKTYSAILKMKEYNSGAIGFPLRLLARENFEKGKKIFGEQKVALITGEEKIIPENAMFYFCTVESMPKMFFEFIAIDEVQLAANFERGHHFTDKIINFRGTKETWFLGSSSIKNMLRTIIPDLKIVNRSRFSKLNYYGYKNLTRLPKRSAVIAFSQIEIYSLAEKLKKFKGGVSVVTGALSPDARNKQLSLFENGDVDYIVATDAIGLGLNLDIKHVFFSNIVKFDGRKQRYLTFDEIAQIAGRAGRYENDGFFGITENLKKFNNELVEHIENYKFIEIKHLYWRNSDLDFSSSKNLMRSLTKRSRNNSLILKKNSDDIESLKILTQDENISNTIKEKKKLKLLWDICSIPNYTKTLVEYHTEVLREISFYLIVEQKKIPFDLVNKKISQILNVNNENISSINLRIAKIRIWSYISYKNNWLENPILIQSKIKHIENVLSLKLHKGLIRRFVNNDFMDGKVCSQENRSDLISLKENKLLINKRIVGQFEGFSLKLSSDIIYRKKEIFFQKFLKGKIKSLINDLTKKFLDEDVKNLKFNLDGNILWNDALIGKFLKGKDLYNPTIKIFVDYNYDTAKKIEIQRKLKEYLSYLKQKYFPVFSKLIQECKDKKHSSSFRAISYALYENFGYCSKQHYFSYYKQLSVPEVKLLKKLGLEVGNKFIYFKNETFDKKYFSHMLISTFHMVKLNKILSEKVLIKEKKSFNSKRIFNSYKKFGFYKLKIFSKQYLVYFLLFERLSNLINNKKGKEKKISEEIKVYCEHDNFFLKNFCKNRFTFLSDLQINT